MAATPFQPTQDVLSAKPQERIYGAGYNVAEYNRQLALRQAEVRASPEYQAYAAQQAQIRQTQSQIASDLSSVQQEKAQLIQTGYQTGGAQAYASQLDVLNAKIMALKEAQDIAQTKVVNYSDVQSFVNQRAQQAELQSSAARGYERQVAKAQVPTQTTKLGTFTGYVEGPDKTTFYKEGQQVSGKEFVSTVKYPGTNFTYQELSEAQAAYPKGTQLYATPSAITPYIPTDKQPSQLKEISKPSIVQIQQPEVISLKTPGFVTTPFKLLNIGKAVSIYGGEALIGDTINIAKAVGKTSLALTIEQPIYTLGTSAGVSKAILPSSLYPTTQDIMTTGIVAGTLGASLITGGVPILRYVVPAVTIATPTILSGISAYSDFKTSVAKNDFTLQEREQLAGKAIASSIYTGIGLYGEYGLAKPYFYAAQPELYKGYPSGYTTQQLRQMIKEGTVSPEVRYGITTPFRQDLAKLSTTFSYSNIQQTSSLGGTAEVEAKTLFGKDIFDTSQYAFASDKTIVSVTKRLESGGFTEAQAAKIMSTYEPAKIKVGVDVSATTSFVSPEKAAEIKVATGKEIPKDINVYVEKADFSMQYLNKPLVRIAKASKTGEMLEGYYKFFPEQEISKEAYTSGIIRYTQTPIFEKTTNIIEYPYEQLPYGLKTAPVLSEIPIVTLEQLKIQQIGSQTKAGSAMFSFKGEPNYKITKQGNIIITSAPLQTTMKLLSGESDRAVFVSSLRTTLPNVEKIKIDVAKIDISNVQLAYEPTKSGEFKPVINRDIIAKYSDILKGTSTGPEEVGTFFIEKSQLGMEQFKNLIKETAIASSNIIKPREGAVALAPFSEKLVAKESIYPKIGETFAFEEETPPVFKRTIQQTQYIKQASIGEIIPAKSTRVISTAFEPIQEKESVSFPARQISTSATGEQVIESVVKAEPSTGKYAGFGTYEQTTEQNIANIAKISAQVPPSFIQTNIQTPTTVINLAKTSTIPTVIGVTLSGITSALKPSQLNIQAPIQTPAQEQTPTQAAIQIPKVIQIPIQEQTPTQVQIQTPVTLQLPFQVPIEVPVSPFIFVPIAQIPPKLPIDTTLPPILLPEDRRRKKRRKGYRTFVIKKGKRVFLPGVTVRSLALLKGQRETLRTLRATFGIKEAGTIESEAFAESFKPSKAFRQFVFRKGKKIPVENLYIERAGTKREPTPIKQARLVSPIARKELNLARLAKRGMR